MVEVMDVADVADAEKQLVVLFEDGEQDIVELIADVLGRRWNISPVISDAEKHPDATVVGVPKGGLSSSPIEESGSSRVLLYAHCVDGNRSPNEHLRRLCKYEYLYSRSKYLRRDLTRFLSFILGQISHHQDFATRPRTTELCTTFPDVHTALPNLEILSVGADAVELRVDLLKEPTQNATPGAVPSLKYVGQQLLALRQRTELPIIFTTRCTKENGRFPMDDPGLFYEYLYQAIKWGVEYIDVELWLPEDIRRRLSEQKGNSKIISAFHDFSGNFRWASPEAEQLFKDGAVYGDVVKMIALVNTMQENYELEYFRTMIQSKYPTPPFSGLNMGPMGQLSRTLNKIFTPITHPLLPMIAAPGQLSAAEINSALYSMGNMPKLDIYGIGPLRSAVSPLFFERCFNELSLPHRFVFSERPAKDTLDLITRNPAFGGAYLNPPIATATARLPNFTDAAKAIGQVDTVLVTSSTAKSNVCVGANVTWKGIRATLCRDFVPSAYKGSAALILANAEADATAAIFALKSLGIGPIYTVGFQGQSALTQDTHPVRSVEDMKLLEHPFAVISALPSDKSMLVGPLLKYYGAAERRNGATTGKVFVDLADGLKRTDPLSVATSLGWTAYGIADVRAWTTVERIRLVVGETICFDFCRAFSNS
ncbi:aldolase [Rhizodiscina lignyota]|uniref:Aldolase n=1 Tax=Rhizodiscina lignyota TaxID=1504668 RepID=A0A9P4IGK9_9PEZI|nr:aldolase [Rhizodiscina lignyota]